ncbi:hypothetical protein [Bacillus sp. NA_165.1]|uniref:hypothetical protein n=1 Tax=unclassified Bacillus (in: firmicutes) TaxID=185979 RepID=UPI0040454D6A
MTNVIRHGEAGNDTSLVTISYKSCNTSKTRLFVYVEELYPYTSPDCMVNQQISYLTAKSV